MREETSLQLWIRRFLSLFHKGKESILHNQRGKIALLLGPASLNLSVCVHAIRARIRTNHNQTSKSRKRLAARRTHYEYADPKRRLFLPRFFFFSRSKSGSQDSTPHSSEVSKWSELLSMNQTRPLSPDTYTCPDAKLCFLHPSSFR